MALYLKNNAPTNCASLMLQNHLAKLEDRNEYKIIAKRRGVSVSLFELSFKVTFDSEKKMAMAQKQAKKASDSDTPAPSSMFTVVNHSHDEEDDHFKIQVIWPGNDNKPKWHVLETIADLYGGEEKFAALLPMKAYMYKFGFKNLAELKACRPL
jgi:hypothetical protein